MVRATGNHICRSWRLDAKQYGNNTSISEGKTLKTNTNTDDSIITFYVFESRLYHLKYVKRIVRRGSWHKDQ